MALLDRGFWEVEFRVFLGQVTQDLLIWKVPRPPTSPTWGILRLWDLETPEDPSLFKLGRLVDLLLAQVCESRGCAAKYIFGLESGHVLQS